MENPYHREERDRTMMHVRNGAYEFPASAVEIQILDARGMIVWKKQKIEEPDRIRWDGVTTEGKSLSMGDYICKIRYVDGQTAYVPFVFIKLTYIAPDSLK